ncbi:MAG TPA: lipopolysaccharide heptosyltransferase II [Phycisphaerae bacterium]|nr:lipopolysaccharide heptosyltransferase II [Phycisphaerae bacterium]
MRDSSLLPIDIGSPGRILISVPNWVGDVVMATAALSSIRRRYPSAWITHLQRRYVAPVLADLDLANETLYWPEADPAPGMPRTLMGLVRRLRRERYDLALLLTNSFRSAICLYLAGARRRVGYARDGRSVFLTHRLSARKVDGRFVPVPALDYYNDLARFVGCQSVTDQLVLATSPADEAAIDERLGTTPADRPLVVLNPGANYGFAKCWPAEKYAALADQLIDRYNARVVASLSPTERDIADRLAETVRRRIEIFVSPPLGLGPLKALIRRCQLLITNDTGPRHFAAAFGVPVITIFGSSDPAWTETRFAKERIVKLHLDCQPCMERVCPLKHHHCMKLLEPELVLEKAAEFLSRPLKSVALHVNAGTI